MIELSLLVCSLINRSQLADNLKRVLNYQSNESVEMLICRDNGERSIGKKRQDLLTASKGKYICYLDDDDMISPFYVSKILEGIKESPDCVGISGWYIAKQQEPKMFIHSIKYTEWFEKNGIYYRCPNHLNPIKREIALQVGFPNISNGEDHVYSMKLRNLLKTEYMIEEPIYYYYPSKG